MRYPCRTTSPNAVSFCCRRHLPGSGKVGRFKPDAQEGSPLSKPDRGPASGQLVPWEDQRGTPEAWIPEAKEERTGGSSGSARAGSCGGLSRWGFVAGQGGLAWVLGTVLGGPGSSNVPCPWATGVDRHSQPARPGEGRAAPCAGETEIRGGRVGHRAGCPAESLDAVRC